MIISFYDKDFKGLQNNASLVVDNKSYSLIKRGVELDELKCTCEPFTENIQPTFLIVRNDRGRYVYGSLAGIPELTNEKKTNVVGTDLKSMLKSDVILEYKNLFTKNNAPIINGYFQLGETKIVSAENNRITYIKCQRNTTYSVSKLAGSRFAVGYTNTLPNIGVTVYGIVQQNSVATLTITTGNDAEYLCVYYMNTSAPGGHTEQEYIDSIKITTITTVKDMFDYVFGEWDTQVNQGGFDCELEYKQYTSEQGTSGAADIPLTELKHQESGKYDAWNDIFSPYLKYYGLYMTSRIDLINKKVIFTIGKSMLTDLNIKLWEQGIYDYGKKIADVNECQGYVLLKGANEVYTAGYKWILTSQNAITTNASLRDIVPVKRRLIIKETEDGTKVSELLNEANREALELLCESLYKENITLSVNGDFETKFNIYVKRGGGLYKSLPCGELHYDANGLKQLQIGHRFTGLQFLL